MNMHYCTCKINLSGQGFHIIDIYPQDPLSWPEVQILMAIHGEENVFDIKPVSLGDTSPTQEKRRLLAKYKMVVEQVFPGRVPRMEMLMPGELEDQPRADEYGAQIPVPEPDPEDDDEKEVLGREPPIGPAVFKPGGHPRPQPRPFPPASEPT